MSLALSAAIFVVTLALIFAHPRGMNEAVAAGVGAAAMLACRIVSPSEVGRSSGKRRMCCCFCSA